MYTGYTQKLLSSHEPVYCTLAPPLITDAYVPIQIDKLLVSQAVGSLHENL